MPCLPNTDCRSSAAHPPAPPLQVALRDVFSARLRYGEALQNQTALELAAIIDPETRLARSWARSLSAKPEIFASYADFIASQNAAQAILLASPLLLRQKHIAAALSRGLAVLCEYPFAYRLKTHETLISECALSKALLTPVFPRRFDLGALCIQEALAARAVGEIRQVRCEWSLPLEETLCLENGADEADDDTLMQYALCQSVDLANFWLGEAHTVSADVAPFRKERLSAPRRRRTEETIATLLVAHEAALVTHVFQRTRAAFATERYIFQGTRGRLEYLARPGAQTPSLALPCVRLVRRDSEETLKSAASAEEWMHQRMQALLLHFAQCVQSQAAPKVSLETAQKALCVVHASFLSTLENAKVALPLRRAPDFEPFFRRFEAARQIPSAPAEP